MEQYALTEAQREQVQQWLCDCPSTGGRNLLSALSYNLRRVLELRYGLADGHRYSIEETARVLEKPTSWVVEIESGAIILLFQFLMTAGSSAIPQGSQCSYSLGGPGIL